jgi:hypothetical protein
MVDLLHSFSIISYADFTVKIPDLVSLQIGRVNCPSRWCQLSPFVRTSLPERMLRHKNDGLDPNGASKKEHVGKYRALKTLENKDCGFCKILQHCFARRAVLKEDKFLNPNPPSVLAVHNLSHFIQCNFCSFCCYPHQ